MSAAVIIQIIISNEIQVFSEAIYMLLSYRKLLLILTPPLALLITFTLIYLVNEHQNRQQRQPEQQRQQQQQQPVVVDVVGSSPRKLLLPRPPMITQAQRSPQVEEEEEEDKQQSSIMFEVESNNSSRTLQQDEAIDSRLAIANNSSNINKTDSSSGSEGNDETLSLSQATSLKITSSEKLFVRNEPQEEHQSQDLRLPAAKRRHWRQEPQTMKPQPNVKLVTPTTTVTTVAEEATRISQQQQQQNRNHLTFSSSSQKQQPEQIPRNNNHTITSKQEQQQQQPAQPFEIVLDKVKEVRVERKLVPDDPIPSFRRVGSEAVESALPRLPPPPIISGRGSEMKQHRQIVRAKAFHGTPAQLVGSAGAIEEGQLELEQQQQQQQQHSNVERSNNSNRQSNEIMMTNGGDNQSQVTQQSSPTISSTLTNPMPVTTRGKREIEYSVVRIRSNLTELYICFNEVGQLQARVNGNGASCLFNELIVDAKYVNYQSNLNTSWFLGFDSHGRPVPGEKAFKRDNSKKSLNREKCYQFLKSESIPVSTSYFPEALPLLGELSLSSATDFGHSFSMQQQEPKSPTQEYLSKFADSNKLPQHLKKIPQRELINMTRFRNILRYQLDSSTTVNNLIKTNVTTPTTTSRRKDSSTTTKDFKLSAVAVAA